MKGAKKTEGNKQINIVKEKIIRFFTGRKTPTLLYHKEKETERKVKKRYKKKKKRRKRENYQRRNLLRQKKTEGILYKSYNLSVKNFNF